jgi:hypothetical protein
MLDRLPSDAPGHVELIDGSLVLQSPRTMFHMLALRLFERELDPPGHLVVVREMTVTLGLRQRPEPDVLLVKESAARRIRLTTFELEPAVKAYVPTGIHRGQLRTDIGFPVDIDLDLDKIRR